MDHNNIQYIDGKIVKEYTEAELDAHIASLQEEVMSIQAMLDNLQDIKDSIV